MSSIPSYSVSSIPSPAQARVIDPILSNHAQQYRNADYVLEALFPVVTIGQRGGRVIRFNKESFHRYNTRRAPGAATKRVQFGYASDPIALLQDSLEGLVPMELQQEANAVPGIDLAGYSVSGVLDTMSVAVEHERARIATDPAHYGVDNKIALAGADQWSDPTANVKDQLDTGKEAIRKRIGRYPNTLVVPPGGLNALEGNEAINDRVKYTSSESITEAMLARYFKVDRVIVPKAVSLGEDDADDADFTDVWGNVAVLAWVPPSVTTYHVPSFGYTYRLTGYPFVEEPYYERNAKSWVYPVTIEERAYHTAGDAGYLIQNLI